MGGTFYATESEVTEEAYFGLRLCLKEDTKQVLALIEEGSDRGLALKNDYALYALAVATLSDSTSEDGRRAAFKLLPKIARTGTHLFQFVGYRKGLGGGWGKLMRSAIQSYYKETPLDRLAFQVTKYQQRDGWSHRDLLRLSHPRAMRPIPEVHTPEVQALPEMQRGALLRWIMDGIKGYGGHDAGKWPAVEPRPAVGEVDLPTIVHAFELAKTTQTEVGIVGLIEKYGLSREMIPTQFLDKPAVQEALLEKMPLHALIRNLGNLTKSGLLTATSAATLKVIHKLSDAALIQRSRVHPFACFVALNTYRSGHGLRGRGAWNAVPRVIDALDDAMYAAVSNIPVTGKGIVLGIDGSNSMGTPVADLNCSVRDAAVAMALFTLKAEPGARVVGFTHRAVAVPLSPKQRVDDAVTTFKRFVVPENTDCALPMLFAMSAGWNDIGAFVTYTDNETWAGSIHPAQAVEQYRKRHVAGARHVAVAMTATKYSVADEKDPLSMNVVGFSADAAKVIGDFIGASK
jgi:60 kDa SS-A/Ro ribonucleoprotein